MSNKYLAAATAHFQSLGTPSITVPEWTVDGAPVKIFWKPLTALEREEIFAGGSNDVDIFIRKALDADGSKLFTIEHKRALQIMVAPQIISRVAVKMMELPSVEDVEKNSGAIPSV